ncbi:enoyl-CoA hydratase-related protein [Acinetobacter shaoyimingii]|uniref:Enoyl-CoA hydratase n=1 Tax=Acinetobacter shaoyimingii TaxID=2715164 RepID=A0A6G8RUB3_9GAMM|nr:enoyl-CoA hydratase-related protein [Acinetobacter shaoyimingii]QIO05549.1 enoyl-CoA hydratase [Acinetobacter shaoyimingii]
MTLSCIQQPHEHLNANLENGVLTLAIHRPEAKNALYSELYLSLVNALNEADQNNQVRVVILRGEGADFTAGNDMQDFMKSAAMKGQIAAEDGPPFLLLKAAAQFSKPLLVAVKGVAIGIGVTILLHADLVYSDNTALFQIPFVSLGLSPEGASSKLLIQQAGYHKAAELLLTAKKFDSATAASANLVNHIVEDAYAEAEKQAAHLAALPLASLVATKALMKHNLDEIVDCINHEARIFMDRVGSPEMLEAVQAFMQKRKPDFTQFN